MAVVLDQDGQAWCSCLGLPRDEVPAPSGRDGNGFIARINLDGSVAESTVFPAPGDPPLNDPKGMAVMSNYLWVTDIDRMVVYDLRRRQQLGVIPLREHGVRAASDCVAIGDDLLVADHDGDQLILLRGAITGSVTSIEVVERGGLGSPCGLAYSADLDLLYVTVDQSSPDGEPGAICSFTWSDQLQTVAQLAFPVGEWHGIARSRPGAMYATDKSAGTFWRLSTESGAQKLVDDLKQPGDFCLIDNANRALIPEMGANCVRSVLLIPAPAASPEPQQSADAAAKTELTAAPVVKAVEKAVEKADGILTEKLAVSSIKPVEPEAPEQAPNPAAAPQAD